MADIEFIEPAVEAELVIEDTGRVDPSAQAPRGRPCASCGSPVESDDHYCPACGASQLADAVTIDEEPTDQKFFRCDNCAAEVATTRDQRSFVCPFCDSTYVAEFSPASGRQRPEFVIGFAVTEQQARDAFRLWIKRNSWFRPGDLKMATLEDKQRGVYLPFWSFSMLARSQWRGTIGEYWYRTETYTTTDSKGKTVTRTRQVRETEWWPLSGQHHQYYSGFLVSGSRGLPQTDAHRIKPFQLPALKRYEPYYLAGWLSEEYSVDRGEALQISQQEFYNRERSVVAAFMPGDTHRDLSVETRFQHVNSDLCLLPVYVLSYEYKRRLYRFLVNGQTGKVAGDKPWSGTRIGVVIALGVVLIALLVLLVIFLTNG